MNINFFSKGLPLKNKKSSNITLNKPLIENREEFIANNKNFIYTATYQICKRKLCWENDDELSIALIAFNKACDTYITSKGNFHNYANMVIRNALIDYFRKNKNIPYLMFDTKDTNSNYIDMQNSLNEYEIQCENKNRQLQIKLFSDELKKYKLSFEKLVKASPSHNDTRNNLLSIAFSCINNKSIINHIKCKKRLPVKQIVLLTNCNKKLIERWRIYILSLILILSNDDFIYLKSYLNIKAGDNDD